MSWKIVMEKGIAGSVDGEPTHFEASTRLWGEDAKFNPHSLLAKLISK